MKKYTDPQNLRAEILEIGPVELEYWDPVRSINDKAEYDRANKLLVRGIVKPVLRLDQDLEQYSIKQGWGATYWLPSRPPTEPVILKKRIAWCIPVIPRRCIRAVESFSLKTNRGLTMASLSRSPLFDDP